VRPLATGFLVVTDLLTSGQRVTLQPALRLEAGTSVSFAVPGGSIMLTVEFSAKAPAQDVVNSLAIGNIAGIGGTTQTAPKEKEAPISTEKAGRVEESPPTPEPHVSVTLAVPTE
jgi:hypothetical protein